MFCRTRDVPDVQFGETLAVTKEGSVDGYRLKMPTTVPGTLLQVMPVEHDEVACPVQSSGGHVSGMDGYVHPRTQLTIGCRPPHIETLLNNGGSDEAPQPLDPLMEFQAGGVTDMTVTGIEVRTLMKLFIVTLTHVPAQQPQPSPHHSYTNAATDLGPSTDSMAQVSAASTEGSEPLGAQQATQYLVDHREGDDGYEDPLHSIEDT